jgi:hypothetical protein
MVWNSNPVLLFCMRILAVAATLLVFAAVSVSVALLPFVVSV